MDLERQDKLDEILEIVRFIKDHGATQDYVDERFTSIDERFTSIDERFKSIDERFDEFENRMAQEFLTVRNEMEHGFADVHAELREIRSELESVKMRLDGLEIRTKEDTDVVGSDYIELRRRVRHLEQKIKKLELAY